MIDEQTIEPPINRLFYLCAHDDTWKIIAKHQDALKLADWVEHHAKHEVRIILSTPSILAIEYFDPSDAAFYKLVWGGETYPR